MKTKFTLIEMLVVSAVLLVLAALMLPGLRRVMDLAQVSACASQLKQIGQLISIYGDEYRGLAPKNCHNPTEAAGNRLPNNQFMYTNYVGGLQTSFRYDSGFPGNPDDFSWAGLGILVALDYLPYGYNGARVFYCPAESIGDYDKSTSNWGGAWGYWWNKPGVNYQNNRWTSIGSQGPTVTSYAYGSVRERYDNRYAIPVAYKPPRYDLLSLGNHVAVVEGCASVPGSYTTAPQRVYNPHGGRNRYFGFNRLWFDSSVKWLNDRDLVWAQWLPNQDTNFGNLYGTVWKHLDDRDL